MLHAQLFLFHLHSLLLLIFLIDLPSRPARNSSAVTPPTTNPIHLYQGLPTAASFDFCYIYYVTNRYTDCIRYIVYCNLGTNAQNITFVSPFSGQITSLQKGNLCSFVHS